MMNDFERKNVNQVSTACKDVKTYKVHMYVRCTEEDADSLRKLLAQAVFDGFEFDEHNAVFGVEIVLDD